MSGEKHNLSVGSERPTDEEAALILNEMSTGRSSRLSSQDQSEETLQLNGQDENEPSTTDLSGIDLISK